MKILTLILFTLLSGTMVFAQKADSPANRSVSIKNSAVVMNPSNNILNNLTASPDFSILLNAIKTADLADTFSGAGPITIFAPTDKAFAKLAYGQLDTLLQPAHKAELANLVMYHAIAGKITSKDLDRQIKAGNGQATLTTLAGGMLIARVNENRNIVLTDENGGQSVISRFNIQQGNGIMHIITVVLVPHSK